MEVPDQVDPDGAIVSVEACGICGSDYEQYLGAYYASGAASYPTIPGHESVGRILAVGDRFAAQWHVGEGDRVAIDPIVACRSCSTCRGGHAELCRNRQFLYGFRPTTVGCGLWGGYAEHLVVRPGTTVHRLANDLSPEDAVLFNPLGAGFDWAVRLGGVGPGSRVLIYGPGMRGLASVVAARLAGAERIVVAGRSRSPYRLAAAEALRATDTVVDDYDGGGGAAVRDLLVGDGVDVVIDTTSRATQPLIDAVDLVVPGGTIVWAGIKHDSAATLPFDQIVRRGITIKGAPSVSSWGTERAVGLLNSGLADLSVLHTHSSSLADAERAVRIVGGEIDEANLHITLVPERVATR